jgi:hypothetical protein
MPEPGAVVAGYRLETLIAQDETGVVYEATKLSVEQSVALKLLDARLSADPEFRERFQREGRIQTAIDHPNLVAVLEVGECEYGLFVAIEAIRAGSLKELVAGETLDAERTVRILGQAADALDTVHRAGLIHGDIRPDTILVRTDGSDHVYLTGFGVTEDRHEGLPTAEGGTGYMAPEVIRGEAGTTSTDIYGLGAVLYESLAGSVPFPGESPAAVANAHLNDPPPRLTEGRPELPAELDDVVAKAMAKDPADRHATAAEMVQALDQVSAALAPVPETTEAPAASVPESTGEEAGRRRPVFWAGAAAAVLGLAAAGFLLGRGGSSKAESAAPMVRLKGVRLRVPPGWHHMSKVPRIPGVTFPGAIALATQGNDAKLIASPVDGRWPTLLPLSFERQTMSESDLLARREVVLLGRRQAFRYRDVAPLGVAAPLTVVVVPVRGHVEMLTCALPTDAAPKIAKQCEAIVAGVVLPNSKPYSLLPQASYAQAVSAAVDRLNRAREAGRRELAAARTVAAQALAARRVGAAYGREEQRLKKLSTDLLVAPVHRKIVAQMARVRAAYVTLANSARADQETAFDNAKQLVRTREAGLKKVLLQLRFAGISME